MHLIWSTIAFVLFNYVSCTPPDNVVSEWLTIPPGAPPNIRNIEELRSLPRYISSVRRYFLSWSGMCWLFCFVLFCFALILIVIVAKIFGLHQIFSMTFKQTSIRGWGAGAKKPICSGDIINSSINSSIFFELSCYLMLLDFAWRTWKHYVPIGCLTCCCKVRERDLLGVLVGPEQNR